jgi:hypothetical protein
MIAHCVNLQIGAKQNGRLVNYFKKTARWSCRLQCITCAPPGGAVIGLGGGGLLAAAMATIDSALLSVASMFVQNICKAVILPQVSNFISTIVMTDCMMY